MLNSCLKPAHISFLTSSRSIPPGTALILQEYPEQISSSDARIFDQFDICCDANASQIKALCVRIEQGRIRHIVIVSALLSTVTFVLSKVRPASSHRALQNIVSCYWIKLYKDSIHYTEGIGAALIAHESLVGKYLLNIEGIALSQPIFKIKSALVRVCTIQIQAGTVKTRDNVVVFNASGRYHNKLVNILWNAADHASVKLIKVIEQIKVSSKDKKIFQKAHCRYTHQLMVRSLLTSIKWDN